MVESSGSQVIDKLAELVPGARREHGTLMLDGEAVAATVRRIDADGAVGYTGDGRVLVTGGDPYARAKLPGPATFTDPAGNLTDYAQAPDVARIADALIARCRDLHFLQNVRVRYLWRRKAQNKNGKMILGTCQKLSGLPQYALGGGEFLIVINRWNCGLAGLRAWQLEALVYHELNHITPPDEDDPESTATIVGHDFEGFGAELRRYGPWHESLEQAGEAFEDLPLFAGMGERND